MWFQLKETGTLDHFPDAQQILNLSRSPSPPPQYDNFGRRVNTREFRYRKRLEDERHKLVEKAMKTIPNYHPPSDYRRPTKTQEKVYVPVNDYPEINFSMITNPLTLLQALSCSYACAVICLYTVHLAAMTSPTNHLFQSFVFQNADY